MIEVVHKTSKSTVLLDNQVGTLFHTTVDVRQGYSLSLVPFNIFLETYVARVVSRCLCLAVTPLTSITTRHLVLEDFIYPTGNLDAALYGITTTKSLHIHIHSSKLTLIQSWLRLTYDLYPFAYKSVQKL